MSTVTYVFRTPYVQRRVPVIPPVNALMNFSLAVLRINGQWVETEYPSEQQIDAADLYFPGGHDNIVDAATALILQGAGYTLDSVIADPTAIVGSAVIGTSLVG